MNKNPVRGEIWLVDWSPGRGSEQGGLRPAVVIQTDEANRNERYPNVIVLTVSTKGKPVPFHISARPSMQNNLKGESFIKCEQILTISKERLIRRIGLMEKEYMEKVKQAVKLVLELD